MDEIKLVDYDPHWPALFEEEVRCLLAALRQPSIIQRLEHIGSTAIPNMPAKPIIDIQIGVISLAEAAEQIVPVLEAMGYRHWDDNPLQDRLFMVKGLPPNGPRTHHIHIVTLDHPAWECLFFRDYLRVHPEEAARYAALKQDLASRFEHDRKAYSAGKAEYVRRITELARNQ